MGLLLNPSPLADYSRAFDNKKKSHQIFFATEDAYKTAGEN